MSPIRQLRESFTPYEIAAAGQVLSLLFFVGGILFLVSGRGPRGMFILLAIGAICGLAGYLIGRCPNCGKAARKVHHGPEERYWAALYYARFWPERECSSCRTPLDVI